MVEASDSHVQEILGQIGQRVVDLRRKLGFTQEKFAVHVGSGTSVDVIKKLETGRGPKSRSAPSYGPLQKLDPTIADLVGKLPQSSAHTHTDKPQLGCLDLTCARPTLTFTRPMMNLFKRPALFVAAIDYKQSEFVPRITETKPRLVDSETVEIAAPLNPDEYHVRYYHHLNWLGESRFAGHVVSCMGIYLGSTDSTLRNKSFGGTSHIYRNENHYDYVIGIACSRDDAETAAAHVWNAVNTQNLADKTSSQPQITQRPF